MKKMKISVTTNSQMEKNDLLNRKSMTPSERLDLVEQLRIESGKFLYEYPAGLRRIIKITRKNKVEY
jgi:hypothetical protein